MKALLANLERVREEVIHKMYSLDPLDPRFEWNEEREEYVEIPDTRGLDTKKPHSKKE